MADDGWIKLHRKVQEWKFWRREKFTWGQAWIDMLLMANHQKRSFSVRGNTITINPGQIGHSEDTLAEKWLWSRGKVRRFLGTLEMEQQIVQQKSHILNVITVLNWDSYQLNDTADGTTERQQTDTNKNVKNVKNINTRVDVLSIWNQTVTHPIPKIKEISNGRDRKLSARLKEHPDQEFWQVVIAKINDSDFCRGKNERGWKATFDWLIRDSTNVVKVFEGNFDNREKADDRWKKAIF